MMMMARTAEPKMKGTRPLPTPAAFQANRSSEDLFSKSLGDYPAVFQRHSSDISCITHSGYLLKRSSQPFPTVSPITGEYNELDNVQSQPRLDTPDNETATKSYTPILGLPSESMPTSPRYSDSRQEMDDYVKDIVEFALILFGTQTGQMVQNIYETKEKETQTPKQQLPLKSAPIKMSQSQEAYAVSRAHSVPLSSQNNNMVEPVDVVSPDGHVWRAKFCVLENGILYFYRHQYEAESQEAHYERQQASTFVNNQIDVSPNLNIEDGEHLWERRIALHDVGAVRSAEVEYGENSFELIPEDEDDPETLVLRARDKEEMREWIFEFHRSIATFVKRMMDDMGSARKLDIHHPTLSFKPTASPLRSTNLVSYSPRLGKQLASLSHGHGRHKLRLHRRRQDSDAESPPLPNLLRQNTFDKSDSPLFPFPMISDHERRIVTPFPPRFPDYPSEPTSEPIIPERSAPQSADPETERPLPVQPGKYIPPHLRNRVETVKYVPPRRRNKEVSPREADEVSSSRGLSLSERLEMGAQDEMPIRNSVLVEEIINNAREEEDDCRQLHLGGCADPNFVFGSVLDDEYIPRKVSVLGKVDSNPIGFTVRDSAFQWEIGAVSECGVRESNEDAFLITGDLSLLTDDPYSVSVWNRLGDHPPGLVALFDGHCGNHAARFAAERLPTFIHEEARQVGSFDEVGRSSAVVESILQGAIAKLDKTFCDLCVQEGRDWESGATALIVALVNENIVIANLGDARAVMGCSVANEDDTLVLEQSGWNRLPAIDCSVGQCCLWKIVSVTHSPSTEEERQRIEQANGWITTETEIPVGQLKRMALFDEDVVDILKRCFASRYMPSPKASAPQRILEISRVCGELAVSRSIGDRDFKAAFNTELNAEVDKWSAPFLVYPENHSGQFSGDLVSGIPAFQTFPVGRPGVFDEFLLLACDGLWDIMDPDDAIRVTRDLLFEKKWPAKKAAARLAELAIHLGSSDNITVIIIRFIDRDNR